MSVREELQEVLDWLADLAAARPKSEPAKPKPLSSQDWEAVRSRVEAATEKFIEARQLLKTQKEQSFLYELAGDLLHQSRGLELRARMLKRRATPDSPARAEEKEKAREQRDEEASKKRERTGKDEIKKRPARRPDQERAKTPLEDPADLLASAQGSLGTAHENLHTHGDLDPVAAAYEVELEVLGEMTLSLIHRYEQANG